eukprot:1160912-Pelagomonas_calceolata.AAC.8
MNPLTCFPTSTQPVHVLVPCTFCTALSTTISTSQRQGTLTCMQSPPCTLASCSGGRASPLAEVSASQRALDPPQQQSPAVAPDTEALAAAEFAAVAAPPPSACASSCGVSADLQAAMEMWHRAAAAVAAAAVHSGVRQTLAACQRCWGVPVGYTPNAHHLPCCPLLVGYCLQGLP